MSPPVKVYCGDCKYYESRGKKDICHYKTGKRDTPIKRVAKHLDPNEKNKNNNCNLYEVI